MNSRNSELSRRSLVERFSIQHVFDKHSLLSAALNGDMQAVIECLKQKGDVNFSDNLGRTILMAACQEGHLEVVQYLIEHNANVNQTNHAGMSALAYAISGKHQDVIECLLENLADMELECEDGKTVLMKCIEIGSTELVKYVDRLGCNIFHKDKAGKNALIVASEAGNLDIVKYIVCQGCRKGTVCSDGLTACEHAFINDNVEVHEWLQSYFTENSTAAKEGESLLSHCKEGKVSAVRELLKQGYNANYRGLIGDSPLTVASGNGNLEVVEMLVQKKAEINYRNPHTGRTALFLAAMKGHAVVVNYLIQKGANIHIPDRKLHTPLMAVAEGQYAGICGDLLKNEARTNSRDQSGFSAIAHASKCDSVEVATLLFHYGSNPNIGNVDGIQPLALAALNGNMKMVKCLVQNNADINQKDKKGRQPVDAAALSLASEESKIKMIKYLVDMGAEHQAFERIYNLQRSRNQNRIIQLEDIQKCVVTYEAEVKQKNILNRERSDLSEGPGLDMKEMEERFIDICFHIPLDEEAAVKLLDKGVNINLAYGQGRTLLSIAVIRKLAQLVEWMISKGADVNFRCTDGSSPLMFACQVGDVNMIRLLIENNTDVNIRDNSGSSALLFAVGCDNEYVVELLLRHEAIVDIARTDGVTPLMIAATKHNIDLVKLLAKYEASLDLTDNEGRTALAHCVLHNPSQSAELLTYLIQKGAKVDIPDMNGDTPLLLSINGQNTVMVDILLSHKADINVLNSAKQNAFTMVLSAENFNLLFLLFQYYKDVKPELISLAIQYLMYNNYFEVMDLLLKKYSTLQAINPASYVEMAKAALHQNNYDLVIYLLTQRFLMKDDVIDTLNISAIEQNKNVHEILECWVKLNTGDNISAFFLANKLGYYGEAMVILDKENKILSTSCVEGTWDNESFVCIVADTVKKIEDITPTECPNENFLNQGKYDQVDNGQLIVKTKDVNNDDKLNNIGIKDGEIICVQRLEDIKQQVTALEDALRQREMKLDEINIENNELSQRIDGMGKDPSPVPVMCETIGEEYAKMEGSTGAAKKVQKTRLLLIIPPSDGGNNTRSHEHRETLKGNSNLVIAINHPKLELRLFMFHKTVSQYTLDGRQVPSNSCAIISLLFAYKFIKNPVYVQKRSYSQVLDEQIYDYVEAAIREGNHIHDINYKGQPVDLAPEDVNLLVSHLGVELKDQTDVDTREPQTVVNHVRNLKENQLILFIKNKRVVSVLNCNSNNGVLLFDSHSHYYSRREYGAYLFHGRKTEHIIKELFPSYDMFCDPYPFYGKFAIFEVKSDQLNIK